MRKFINTIVMTACALLAINMMFAICVLSYRNIKLLVEGLINISLVLELIASVVIFGILVAIFKYTDDNNHDHLPTPSIKELGLESTEPEQSPNPFKQIRSCVCDSDDDEILERVRKGMSLENLSDSEKLELDEWNKKYNEVYNETLDKLRKGE